MDEKNGVSVISESSPSNYISGVGAAIDLCIRLKRNTSQGWLNSNPILSWGEPGVEFSNDGIRFKIGDGVNQWANLPYAIGAVDDGVLK